MPRQLLLYVAAGSILIMAIPSAAQTTAPAAAPALAAPASATPAVGAEAASAPAGGLSATPAPTSQPAAEAPPAGPDYCKQLLDDYDAAKERQAFLAAAGVDNEMDPNQFDADKAKGGGFVRSFDRWEGLLRFDKNGNRKIDWFEADAYRQDLRTRLLAAFDADKDGKLAGAERDQANLALARGWAGLSEAQRTRLAAGAPAGGALAGRGGLMGGSGALARRLSRQEMIAKYDRDGDGQLSEEERAAAIKDFEEEQRQEMLKKYDKDGDGKLSEEELAAMREDQRRQAQPWQLTMQKVAARLFDTDENGQLTEAGKAQAQEFQKKFQEIGKEYDVRFNDLDGDGKVTDEERKQVQAEWRKQSLRLIGMGLRYLDADGDGKVTPEERDAFMQRAQQGMDKWITKFVDKYDVKGTGKLDDEERAELLKGLREEIDQRVKKFDTEGKGRLTPSQTLDMMEDFAKEIGLAPKPKAPAAPTPSATDQEEP